jgi:hypothetical protein
MLLSGYPIVASRARTVVKIGIDAIAVGRYCLTPYISIVICLRGT